MSKTILISGSTDGIGLETAKVLAHAGHKILLHGRNSAKLDKAQATLRDLADGNQAESYVADLSRPDDVVALADAVSEKHKKLDVLINNAGVYAAGGAVTEARVDLRFMVNTIAPYLLTRLLLPILGTAGRVVNVSSAAQAPVNLAAMQGGGRSLSDAAAYAQSKLALIMWSRHMTQDLAADGPVIVAVNPASMLGSKMVKEAYGVAGGDLGIGADILMRAAVAEEFEDASGKYFDNDRETFSLPHRDALDPEKNEQVVRVIEAVLDKK